MKFKYFISLIACSLALGACALFTVGESYTPRVTERSQRSPEAVVHLWKAELDSNNTRAAAELMIHSSGRALLAIERHELQDELRRIKKLMSDSITSTSVDSLSDNAHDVRVVLNYHKKVVVSTMKKEDVWFVSRVRQ